MIRSTMGQSRSGGKLCKMSSLHALSGIRMKFKRGDDWLATHLSTMA